MKFKIKIEMCIVSFFYTQKGIENINFLFKEEM